MQERYCNKNCCTPTNPNNTQSNHTPNNGLAYALYYQLDTLTVATNDGIDFPLTAAESTGDFLSDGNQIQILQPGVYQITYMVNIPAEAAVTTTFALQVNRQNVPGTERVIAKTGVDTPASAIAQTIITVCNPVSIRVLSTAAVELAGAEDEVLASLYIQQLA